MALSGDSLGAGRGIAKIKTGIYSDKFVMSPVSVGSNISDSGFLAV